MHYFVSLAHSLFVPTSWHHAPGRHQPLRDTWSLRSERRCWAPSVGHPAGSRGCNRGSGECSDHCQATTEPPAKQHFSHKNHSIKEIKQTLSCLVMEKNFSRSSSWHSRRNNFEILQSSGKRETPSKN